VSLADFTLLVNRLSTLYGLEALLLLVRLLRGIARLAEHHAALTMLPEEQVQKWTNEWDGPDDYQPENGSHRGMVILKDHDRFDDVAQDRYEHNHQKQ